MNSTKEILTMKEMFELFLCEDIDVLLKLCSHLTSVFTFFFDLCCQMQTLSVNTIICWHGPFLKFDANVDIKCEQGLSVGKVRESLPFVVVFCSGLA